MAKRANSESNHVVELANQILQHKRSYYAGSPSISDQDYDRLEERLRKLDPSHPVLSMVGSEEASSGKKVNHARPMLSLAKCYTEKELFDWQKDRPVLGMQKIDGNSLSVVYEGGKLQLGKTRGNGRVGEDVTEKIRWVPEIPRQLKEKVDVEIRGELYCSQTMFAELSREMSSLGLELPTSPRNIVAGVLGRKSYVELARYFQFYSFDVVSEEKHWDKESECIGWLQKMGFAVPNPAVCKSAQEILAYLDNVLTQMNDGEIGMDGAVFTFEDRTMHDELGSTSHHPRYKMSFKWQGGTAQSLIREVQWATSRLGIVTPVAVIEPVELSGATITNITLHNAAMVQNFNLKPGDKIELVRSGEVIPKFLSVVTAASGKAKLPTHCPSCDSELSFDDVRLRCLNVVGCPDQRLGTILNWIRNAEIDDLSEKRLQAMLDIDLISSIPDLYRLKVEDFLKLPATKEKMATKLFTNIEGSKSLPMARFLSGLGIESAGLTKWEKLLEHHADLDAVQKASVDDLVEIDGFAERSAELIVSGLAERKGLIKELLSVGVAPILPTSSQASEDSQLSGYSVVITGSLSRPRSELQKMIKNAGAKVVSSVSKNTDVVVTNDPESGSSKMKKAKELGIPVWNEQELLAKIEA